ncbi:MAG: HBL/NHE enterotoxin family protein [Xenococcus sp. (in: cyanobacteria)]
MTAQLSPKKTVQLAPDVKSQKDKLAGHVNATVTVARYVAALQSTDISGVNFKTLPTDIQDKLPEDPATLLKKVNEHLATAKQHGQYWSNEIQPDLTKIPQAIINYSSTFNQEMGVMRPLVQELLEKEDPTKRKELTDLFQGLIDNIDKQKSVVQAEISKLKQFNTDITADHGNFSSANNSFAAIKKFEEANITTLNSAIQELDDSISALNKAITAESVAVGVSVGLIAGGGIGLASAETGVGLVVAAVTMVVGMAGLGVAVGELINSIEQKQEAEQKKSFDQLEVNDLTVQVQALDTTEKALNSLVTQSKLAMASVQVILDTWTTLQVKIQAVVTDLEDSEKKIGDIMSLVDLNTAQDQWGQLQAFAKQMQDFEDTVMGPNTKTLKLPPMKVKTSKKAA